MKRILTALMLIASTVLVLCSCNPEKTENKTKTYEITNDHKAPFKYEKIYEKYGANEYQWKLMISDSKKAGSPFEDTTWRYCYAPNDNNKLNILWTECALVSPGLSSDDDRQKMYLLVFTRSKENEKFSTTPEMAYKIYTKYVVPVKNNNIWAWQSDMYSNYLFEITEVINKLTKTNVSGEELKAFKGNGYLWLLSDEDSEALDLNIMNTPFLYKQYDDLYVSEYNKWDNGPCPAYLNNQFLKGKDTFDKEYDGYQQPTGQDPGYESESYSCPC